MKHAFLLLIVFLGSVTPSLAVPPGRYLISCARVSPAPEGQGKPYRGYLFTVARDGTAQLSIASETKVHVRKVEVIDGALPGQFVLNAHFVEELERGGGEVERILTLGISGSSGAGAEVVPGGAIHLKVDVRKLPDPEKE